MGYELIVTVCTFSNQHGVFHQKVIHTLMCLGLSRHYKVMFKLYYLLSAAFSGFLRILTPS